MEQRVQKCSFLMLIRAVDRDLQVRDVCGCRCWRQAGRDQPRIQEPCCADTCTPSWYWLPSHPGQLSLAVHPWVGIMATQLLALAAATTSEETASSV